MVSKERQLKCKGKDHPITCQKTEREGSRITVLLILNLGVDDQNHASAAVHLVKGSSCQL
jgi:hypothetical protein